MLFTQSRNQPGPFSHRRRGQLNVQGRHWYCFPKRQFQIGSVIDRQMMSTRKPENVGFLGLAIHSEPQPGKLAKEAVCA